MEILDWAEGNAEKLVQKYLDVEPNEVFSQNELKNKGDYYIGTESSGDGQTMFIDVCFGDEFEKHDNNLEKNYEYFTRYAEDISDNMNYDVTVMTNSDDQTIMFQFTDWYPEESEEPKEYAQGGELGKLQALLSKLEDELGTLNILKETPNQVIFQTTGKRGESLKIKDWGEWEKGYDRAGMVNYKLKVQTKKRLNKILSDLKSKYPVEIIWEIEGESPIIDFEINLKDVPYGNEYAKGGEIWNKEIISKEDVKKLYERYKYLENLDEQRGGNTGFKNQYKNVINEIENKYVKKIIENSKYEDLKNMYDKKLNFTKFSNKKLGLSLITFSKYWMNSGGWKIERLSDEEKDKAIKELKKLFPIIIEKPIFNTIEYSYGVEKYEYIYMVINFDKYEEGGELDDEDSLDYNNISDLQSERNRLVRWSNQYGSKGADYKIKQLEERIEYLKSQSKMADGGELEDDTFVMLFKGYGFVEKRGSYGSKTFYNKEHNAYIYYDPKYKSLSGYVGGGEGNDEVITYTVEGVLDFFIEHDISESEATPLAKGGKVKNPAPDYPDFVSMQYEKGGYMAKLVPKMAKGGMITDDEGNLINFQIQDMVIEYKRPNPNQPKREIGGVGKILEINGAMANVIYSDNLRDFEQWIPLKDLKKVDSKMADGGDLVAEEVEITAEEFVRNLKSKGIKATKRTSKNGVFIYGENNGNGGYKYETYFSFSEVPDVEMLELEEYQFFKSHNKMAKGGTFDEKVNSIAKKLEGKPVPAPYRKEYGSRYDKNDAQEAARRIVGNMRKLYGE